MKRPNVLLIMTDQHRFDSLGCYGNEQIETPNIDWIASEGTVFKNAYTPSPSCVPARACLLTGQNTWNVGILGMGGGQGPMGIGFEHTLPGELAKSGYHTKGIGKMHFYPQRSLNGFHDTIIDESGRVEDKGFVSDYKQWFEKNKTGDYDISDHGLGWNAWGARPYHGPEFLHPTNWTVNESLRYLRDRDRSMPFFLKMSFARPHSPYDALPYYFDLYMKKDLPEPYIGNWANMHDVSEDGAYHDAWRGVKKKEEINRARAGYYGSINHIDQQIARVLMELRNEGTFDETLIIFTSDHGDMLGDHHLWRKTYAYEGSAHIPMIIKLPKSMDDEQRLKEVAEPVTLQDIMPTILDTLGLEIPETVDGKSLLNVIKGKETNWRQYVHGEHCTCYSEEQEMQYLTDGVYKYIWLPRLGTEQLFYIEDDKSEENDLAQDEAYQDVLLTWRKRLVNILEKRNCGLTQGDELICQKGKPYMVSPKYQERLEKSSYKWL